MRVAAVLFVASAVVGLDGLWQSFTGAPDVFKAADGSLVPRIASTLEGPNQLAGFLDVALPVLVARLLVHRDRWLTAVVALATLTDILTIATYPGTAAGVEALLSQADAALISKAP